METTIRQILTERGWTDSDIGRRVRRAGSTISPSRYIADRDEWARLSIQAQDLVPVGARVRYEDAEYEVVGYGAVDMARVLVPGSESVASWPVHAMIETMPDATITLPA